MYGNYFGYTNQHKSVYKKDKKVRRNMNKYWFSVTKLGIESSSSNLESSNCNYELSSDEDEIHPPNMILPPDLMRVVWSYFGVREEVGILLGNLSQFFNNTKHDPRHLALTKHGVIVLKTRRA